MTRLDIDTPKGQRTLQQENRAVEIFHQNFPEYTYVATPKDKPASVDAVIQHGNNIVAVVETKCRNTKLATFQNEFGNEWLVTADKIERCRQIALDFNVRLCGFLYLVPDDVLLTITIYNEHGLLVPAMRLVATETQATCNGGKVVRNNAFISMASAKEIRPLALTGVAA